MFIKQNTIIYNERVNELIGSTTVLKEKVNTLLSARDGDSPDESRAILAALHPRVGETTTKFNKLVSDKVDCNKFVMTTQLVDMFALLIQEVEVGAGADEGVDMDLHAHQKKQVEDDIEQVLPLLTSMINHSCGRTNVCYIVTKDKDLPYASIRLQTTLDIKMNEELLQCYLPTRDLPISVRHYQLGFECICFCCEHEGDDAVKSPSEWQHIEMMHVLSVNPHSFNHTPPFGVIDTTTACMIAKAILRF